MEGFLITGSSVVLEDEAGDCSLEFQFVFYGRPPLRSGAWQVPATCCPPTAKSYRCKRILVRLGSARDLATMLLDRTSAKHLEFLGRHPETKGLSAAMKPVAFIIDLSVILMSGGKPLACASPYPMCSERCRAENCLMGWQPRRGPARPNVDKSLH